MQALIIWGGWDGHQPKEVGELFEGMLKAEGFEVEVSSSLDSFLDLDRFSDLKLIVPVVTMATITYEQCKSACDAVLGGVGIAGCHGGMCDAFRESTEWQFMTGGQWVAHPGDNGVRYEVQITDADHPITAGIPNFWVESEQYYLHTDPGNHVLATCEFPHPNHGGPHIENRCHMPTVWTKMYGNGRVFYNALGHQRDVLEAAEPKELMRRGFLWAAGLLG